MILQNNEIISHYNDLPLLKAYHSKRVPFKRENTFHCHSAFEVSLILGGQGLYRVGENTYAFEKNDVFLFSTNEAHCITEVFPGEDLHIINLQFEPRFVWMPGNDTFDLRYLDVFFPSQRAVSPSADARRSARGGGAAIAGKDRRRIS